MEPIEDAEQENNRDALEQPEPSSNRSEYQSSISNPFEALLQSSSYEEVENELSSIFRIDYSDPIRLEELLGIFNIIQPYTDMQNMIGYAREEIERGMLKLMEYAREELGNGVVNLPPVFAPCISCSEHKKLNARNGLRPSTFLWHCLSHTYVWVIRFDSNRTYEKISDMQIKVMSLLMFAALTSKPNIVHFLMKYGNRFLDENFTTDADATPMRLICMKALLSDIITELSDSEVWDSDTLELKTDLSNLPEGLKSKCLNFRLLLRCDPNPYVTTVKLVKTVIDPGIRPLPSMNVVRHVYDSLFPDLGLGLFNPPHLQHICRCVIRRRLYENWQLPDGISQLELPKTLCDYMNFLHD